MNWQHQANCRCWVKNILATVMLTLCLSMLWVSAQAASGPVRLNVDVPPGKWKGVRLQNLPKDAVVAVAVEVADSSAADSVAQAVHVEADDPASHTLTNCH